MDKQDLILERLDAIESQLAVVHANAEAANSLKQELSPIANDAFRVLLHELGDVENGFQLEDLFDLVKRGMLSVRNITYVLEQLENVIDLWRTMEPLLKSTVPQTIAYLDTLEQRGVFRTYGAMLEVRAKVASEYGPEQIEQMGDAFVFLLGMLNKLSDPRVRETIEKGAEAFATVDLTESKEVGPVGMVRALSSKEAKEGLGVILELMKTMGKLK